MLRDRMSNRTSAPSNPGSFVPQEIFSQLGSLTRADADSCDFGVIKLDDTGKVLMVNRYQSELGCVPVPQFENKHYFTQIAPCTNNNLFFGSFKKGVQASRLNVLFPYTFTYRMRPTNVKVHMHRDAATRTNWVLVKKQ